MTRPARECDTCGRPPFGTEAACLYCGSVRPAYSPEASVRVEAEGAVLMPPSVIEALAGDDAAKQELLQAWDRENELRRDAEARLRAAEQERDRLRAALEMAVDVLEDARDIGKSSAHVLGRLKEAQSSPSPTPEPKS